MPGDPGQEGEVGEADLPGIEGGEAQGKAVDQVTGGHGTGGGMAGHAALVADPVDRGGRALEVVLVGPGEGAGQDREAHLEEVDAVAEADEVLAELVLGELEGRRVEECLDGKDEGGERGPLGGDRLPAGVSLSPRVRAERVERVAQLGIEPVGVGLRPLQGSATPTGHDRLIANLEHRGSRDHTTHSCSIEHMFATTDSRSRDPYE